MYCVVLSCGIYQLIEVFTLKVNCLLEADILLVASYFRQQFNIFLTATILEG